MKRLLVVLAFASCALLSAADSNDTLQQQKAAAEALIQDGNNDIAIGKMESQEQDVYLAGGLAVDNSNTRAVGQKRMEDGQAKVAQGNRELTDINAKIKAAADSLRERLAKASFRVWHDKNGRTIRAALEEVQGNNIRILRDDGTEFTLSEDTLSPDDVAWIKNYQNGVTAKAVAAPATVLANTTITAGATGDAVTAPVNVPTNATVIAVSAGDYYSLFLKSDGSLWGMGINHEGELGDGTTTDRHIPMEIVPGGVTAVSAGGYHSLFLKSDGSLWAMGFNNFGELGISANTAYADEPVEIVANGVTAIAAGEVHSLFLKSDGSLWGMGDNSSGQLGDGTTMQRDSPEQIVASGVVAISGSGANSLFLKSDGGLWGMGSNTFGQLGDGTTAQRNTPVQIVASGVTAIAAGGGHSLFVKSDGSLWGMGVNQAGELGDGTTTQRNTPVQIVASGVTAIAAGDFHSLFVKSDGSLWGMGANESGQLGDGTATERDTPVATSLKSNTSVGGSTTKTTEYDATQNRSPEPPDYKLAMPDVPENIRVLAMEAVHINCDEPPRVASVADGSTRELSDKEIEQGELINLDQEFPAGYFVAYGYNVEINGKDTRIISVPQLDRILLFSGPGAAQIVEDGKIFPAMHTWVEQRETMPEVLDDIKTLNKPATAIRCSGIPWVVSYSKGADGHSLIESSTRPLNSEEIELGRRLLDVEFPSGYVVCYPYHVKINGKTTYIISTPQFYRQLIFTGPGAPQVGGGDEFPGTFVKADEFGIFTYPSEPGLFRH